MNVVISGPSGSGKGTVIERLINDFSNIKKAVSYTTRTSRIGERNGVDYNFIDKSTFEKLIDEDFFFEYTIYDGNYYGLPISCLNCSDKDIVIFDLVASSGVKLKEYNEKTKLIYIVPPTLDELTIRRAGRGKDRIIYDSEEMIVAKDNYDSLVINDNFELAYSNIIDSIISNETQLNSSDKEFLGNFFVENFKSKVYSKVI